ncbi:hypothetical protein [Ruminiclostridium cellobioparum]|uniref:hypothetical protein n=1 Tax=Ruminiclostridium cellobioparum TaxID=29355 RepID=UPI000B25386C|nr:hypothetical protein [Ruminiclostridium cellobioparum]
MPDEQQMQEWKEKIEGYKKIYSGIYGKQPSEKLIASFCKINKIPWPLPEPEDNLDFLN